MAKGVCAGSGRGAWAAWTVRGRHGGRIVDNGAGVSGRTAARAWRRGGAMAMAMAAADFFEQRGGGVSSWWFG